jgi:hypothetical protein
MGFDIPCLRQSGHRRHGNAQEGQPLELVRLTEKGLRVVVSHLLVCLPTGRNKFLLFFNFEFGEEREEESRKKSRDFLVHFFWWTTRARAGNWANHFCSDAEPLSAAGSNSGYQKRAE